MKITYSGKPDQLTPSQQRKLDSRLKKLSKLLDRRDAEKEARAILTTERHLHQAEVTVNYFDRQVACVGTGADQFHAIADALDKLEKQILKHRAKWRDTKRSSGDTVRVTPAAPAAAKVKGKQQKARSKPVIEEEEPEAPEAARVFRVSGPGRRKPMTFEEAMIEMESGREFVAYRDSETDKLTVLVRRKDGNYSLIEE